MLWVRGAPKALPDNAAALLKQQQGQGYTFDKVRYSILNNRAIFILTLL